MRTCQLIGIVGLLSLASHSSGLAQIRQETVTQATDLDWTFALANQSLVDPPANWLPEGYDSGKQRYSIAVPPRYSDRKSWPLVLFVSPSPTASGIQQWGRACERQGILIASPLDAGNNVPTPQRIRIVMDVLADIRRKFHVDVDRTYIAGFSGGGRIACALAFALPECFGGVIPVCAGGELRQESWLRKRVIDRLSVAQLTGSSDFNRGEVQRLHQTELSGVGVRCKTWVAQGTGHAIPDSTVFLEAFDWLESDLTRRQQFGQRWPAARIAEPITRRQAADALLDEARKRIADPKTLHSGLMQLKGIRVRWNDLDTSQQALQVLTRLDQSENRSWESEDIAEQRRDLIARARGLDAYGTGDLPKQYQQQRESILKAAVSHWQRIADDSRDAAAAEQANRRIPVLERLLSSPDSRRDR